MIKTKWLFLATLLFINTSYAIEISKGKLLSHTEWASSKVKSFSFKEKIDNIHASKIIPPALFKKQTLNVSHVRARVQSFYGEVSLGDQFINGSAQVNISNIGNETKTYTINTSICTDTYWDYYECANAKDILVLDPEGTAFLWRFPQLEMHYSNPGQYSVYVETTIYNGAVDENDLKRGWQQESIYFNVYDYNYVNVKEKQIEKK